MKRILLLLAVAVAAACAQTSITPIQSTDIIRDSRAVINANFASLNTNKVEGATNLTTANRIMAVSAAGVAKELASLTYDSTRDVVAANYFRLVGQASAPTSPTDGDLWYYLGTLKFRVGALSAWKTVVDTDSSQSLTSKILVNPVIQGRTIASLGTPVSTGSLAIATDSESVGDCTVGGGSFITFCRWNGSAWAALGDGGSGGGLSAPASNGMLYGTTGGTTTARTMTAGTGVTVTNGDGVSGNPTIAADTAVMLTRAQAQSGADLRVVPASGSGSTYTASMSPALTAYTDGMVIQFEPDVDCSAGAVTINIDSLGAKSIKQSDGTTDPGSAALVAGRQVPLTYDGTVFRMAPSGSGSGTIAGTLGTTDNAVTRADGTGGSTAQGSLMTIDDSGTVNIPSGQQYQINGAQHTHAAADITSGTIAAARLGSGTADSTTFLRGDQTYAVPPGGYVYQATDATGVSSSTLTNVLSYSFSSGQLQVGDVLEISMVVENATDTVSIRAEHASSGNDFFSSSGLTTTNDLYAYFARIVVGTTGWVSHHSRTGATGFMNLTGTDNLTAAWTIHFDVASGTGIDTTYARRVTIKIVR